MAKAPELIGSSEACQILGIGRSTLTYWMLTGRISPTQTISSPNSSKAAAHLFAREDVERLAAA